MALSHRAIFAAPIAGFSRRARSLARERAVLHARLASNGRRLR